MSSPPPWLDPADPGPARAALRAWLVLQNALALRPERAAEALRSAGGDPRAALRSSGAPPPPPDEIERCAAALLRCGAVALPLTSPAYPPRLVALRDPSPLLLVRGDPGVLSSPGIAMVGSRAATVLGLAVARRLARDLAGAGLVVISGLARGIDAAAHRGALEAGGRTVAVQACGPERIYPREHRSLARRIERSGAIVTELPPGTPPRREYFPLRNRLISGLARALVVVEARERSGSLITAAHAAEQGVDVFAVPGALDAPTSVGPNRLLRDGACVALEADDVLGSLRLGGLRLARVERPAAMPLPGPESAIVEALRGAPATRDELGRRLERPPERLAPELMQLELAGRVVEDRDGRLRLVPCD